MKQSSPLTGKVVKVYMTLPQLSIAVPASAKACEAVTGFGLHPRLIAAEGQLLKTGAWISDVQAYVTEHVASFPQSSNAVTVHVCDLLQVPVIAAPTAFTDAT